MLCLQALDDKAAGPLSHGTGKTQGHVRAVGISRTFQQRPPQDNDPAELHSKHTADKAPDQVRGIAQP